MPIQCYGIWQPSITIAQAVGCITIAILANQALYTPWAVGHTTDDRTVSIGPYLYSICNGSDCRNYGWTTEGYNSCKIAYQWYIVCWVISVLILMSVFAYEFMNAQPTFGIIPQQDNVTRRYQPTSLVSPPNVVSAPTPVSSSVRKSKCGSRMQVVRFMLFISGLLIICLSASVIYWSATCPETWSMPDDDVHIHTTFTATWYLVLIISILTGFALIFNRPRCPRRCPETRADALQCVSCCRSKG